MSSLNNFSKIAQILNRKKDPTKYMHLFFKNQNIKTKIKADKCKRTKLKNVILDKTCLYNDVIGIICNYYI